MSFPDNASDLNLKIPGTDCSNNGSWNPFGSFSKITHENCLVWYKLGFVIKVVLKNLNFLFRTFGSQCTESDSRLSVHK